MGDKNKMRGGEDKAKEDERGLGSGGDESRDEVR